MADDTDTDSGTLHHLGEKVAFLIKGFPRSYRDQVVAAARMRGVSVAEWLTAHLTQFGIDGVALNIEPKANGEISVGGTLSELRELATMARALTPEDKDSEAMRLARSMVRDALKALRQRQHPLGPLRITSDD